MSCPLAAGDDAIDVTEATTTSTGKVSVDGLRLPIASSISTTKPDTSIQLLPPVDFPKANKPIPQEGEALPPVFSSVKRPPVEMPAPGIKQPIANSTLNASRQLMNELRLGTSYRKPKTISPFRFRGGSGPSAIVQVAGEEQLPLQIPASSEEADQDELTITPPIPADNPPAMDLIATPSCTEGCVTQAGRVSMKDLKKQARRQKRLSRVKKIGGRFIEFYDPELERLDVDDYDKEILLVVGEEEEGTSERIPSKLFARKITDIKPTLDYAWGEAKEKNRLPDDFDMQLDRGEYIPRASQRMVLQWEPTNLWYHPLYFEDVGLERYGHTRKPWLQPFVSTGKFMGQVVGLPYQMTLHPLKSKEFALGYYQPGEWAPKKRYRIPFNEEASAVQFLWVTGLVLLIP